MYLRKQISHFVLAHKIIKSLKITPNRYSDRSNAIYKFFSNNQYSVDYTKKVLRIINLWGRFIARRQGLYFEEIKMPRGRVRSAIEANQLGKTGVKRESQPLTLDLLKKAKRTMEREHYNWLYLSVWLGLRPSEVDGLKNKKLYKVSSDEKGTPVLEVYQSKLMEVSSKDRWKYIPLIYVPQLKTLTIISDRKFKRPHPKTVQKHTAKGVTLYGGRKAFEQLMLDRKQKFEDVADWLGHKSLDTTFKHYRSRKKVRYTKVK